jgi:hypothetical protein
MAPEDNPLTTHARIVALAMLREVDTDSCKKKEAQKGGPGLGRTHAAPEPRVGGRHVLLPLTHAAPEPRVGGRHVLLPLKP